MIIKHGITTLFQDSAQSTLNRETCITDLQNHCVHDSKLSKLQVGKTLPRQCRSHEKTNMKTSYTCRQVPLSEVGDEVKLRHYTSSKEALVIDRLKSNTYASIEAYVRDDINLKCQDFGRGVQSDVKLHLKALDETRVCGLTGNYSLTKVTTKLPGTSGLSILSTVTLFSAIQ